jgi:glycosyltransferase involved in cell wall biosynthesis
MSLTELQPAIAVSLTPVALDQDSRAYRVARTLAEAGYRSIVVEGRKSRSRFWDDSLTVRSVGRSRPERHPSAALRSGRLRDTVTALRSGSLGTVGQGMLYTGFRAYDWRWHCSAPRRLIPPARLYYLHSFEMHRAVAPLAARVGAHIVYDAHDFYREIEPTETRQLFDRQRLRPFYDRLEAALVAEADAVVTVSGGVADLMQYTFGRRPVVIRNCHDLRSDRPNAKDLRRRLRLALTDRLCIVVGNWKPGMAVSTAVAALVRLPDTYHLAFVGHGYEAVAAAFPEDLLGRRLHIGYALAPDEIVPAIRTADLGLVIYEPYSENYRWALPNGFFQIVAAGLPLVRGALPEMEQLIGSRPVGARLPRITADGLVRAILDCARNAAAHRAEMELLKRELCWENEARRLRSLIETVIASQPAHSADQSSGE